LAKELNPRLAEAKAGKQNVFFADAAHFVCGCFLGYIWRIARRFIPTMSGRKRYNVLGAINAISHDLCCYCNETYINSHSVCDLLEMIKSICDNGNPITVIMDNAKYQRCSLVKDFAAKLNIELLFLPSYSPNLNIIERYWKWLKKDCLNCKYYEKFSDLKNAIDSSLSKIIKHEYKAEFDSLLQLNFQLYDNAYYSRA
jgi:transposase